MTRGILTTTDLTRTYADQPDPDARLPGRTSELPLPEIEPKFLGKVASKYIIGHRGTKRNISGDPIDEPETLKSDDRILMATRLITASRNVVQRLGRAARPSNGFALRDDTIPAQPPAGVEYDPAPGSFSHPAGSNYAPQPALLGMVRNATQLYEIAPKVLGKPITQIDEADIAGGALREHMKSRNKNDIREEVAHFRRIFLDIARLIIDLPALPQYNFMYDPETTLATNDPAALNRTAGRWVQPGD